MHQIKRPLRTYLYQLLWTAMVGYWATTNTSEFGRWTLVIIAVWGFIQIVFCVTKRNYFEVTENKLIINESPFKTVAIDLADIEKFEIETNPFSTSKIILKDGKKIKYSDSQVNDGELKKLMEQYGILVE